MRLQHLKSIQPAGKLKQNGRFPRITSICWSPNNCKFAVSNSDRNILIYDSEGKERDKFATKCANKQCTVKKYQITSIKFSPDSTKLAIAQSDNIVYVYRLGEDGTKFGEKKSICNKFAVSAPVTCLCWPKQRNDELVFGLSDGKLKIGILKINGVRKNKSATLFEAHSFVHSIVSSEKGHYFYSIHSNKCVYKYEFPSESNESNTAAKKVLLAQLSFVPNTVQIGGDDSFNDVIVTSIHGNVQIIDSRTGAVKQHFEYTHERVLYCSAMNPSAQHIIFGGFDSFFVLSFNRNSQEWQQQKHSKYAIDNIGTLTSIEWKCDGSKLSIASMIGTVDFYEACLKKYKYSDRFSIVYTALNSVVVHNRFSDDKIVIKAKMGAEISKIEIIQNRFVIGKTEQSLLLSDMQNSALLTEIAWNYSNSQKNEEIIKYNFESFDDNESIIAMIFYSSELFIVEMGSNEVMGSLRTEFYSPYLISLRSQYSLKIVAYLLDLQSICVMDLHKNVEILSINHDCKVEWIELNEFGTQLLFMDGKRSLHLYEVSQQNNTQKTLGKTLLNFCNYAQWVPDSNVIVAQNRNNLCVWYNIHNLSQVTIVDIHHGSEVEDIQRVNDKTVVMVKESEGNNNHSIEYTLNESLITFATALDNKEYESAVTKLERLCENLDISANSEIESMWRQISQIALKNNDYKIAQRCFVALGDISKAQYLSEVIASANSNESADIIKAKLAILSKHFKKAESIYISNGRIDEAICVYLKLNKYSEAIKLCKLRKHPLLNKIRDAHFQYLVANKQFKKAAQFKEANSDYLSALTLYCDNGFALNALDLITKHSIPMGEHRAIADKLIFLFTQKQSDSKSAGLFFEYLGDYKRAFSVYLSGHCYYECLCLAKKYNNLFGDRVCEIESEWAQFCYERKQFSTALPHFIESAQFVKAIQCAIKGKQFGKAIEILKGLNEDSSDCAQISQFFVEIGAHFESIKRYEMASKLYIKSGIPLGVKKAILMELKQGNTDKCERLALKYLANLYTNVNDFYFEEAHKLEMNGNIEGAALILVRANLISDAIQMLGKSKKSENFTKIIEIIRRHKPNKLKSVYLLIGKQLKSQKKCGKAEIYFLKAKEWKLCVAMYDEMGRIEDAFRVCRKYGDSHTFETIVFDYVSSQSSLSQNQAIQTLLNYKLYNKCVDYLLTHALFERAFQIAQEHQCKPHKVNEIRYQYALHLEENGEFEKAELEFIECGKAKEAIEMHIHTKKWDDAVRVAQMHEPNIVAQVYKAHGIVSMEENDLCEAEKWYIEGNCAESAIQMYEDKAMYSEAVRLAQEYMPSLVHQIRIKQMNINCDNSENNINNANSNHLQSMINKANFDKENGNYDECVETLLKIEWPKHSNDKAEVIAFWEESVNISMEKALLNLPNTIAIVAQQLCNVCEFEKSAQYYLEINDTKAAINAFLRANMFDKAREVCKIYNNNDRGILSEIDTKYESYLLSNGGDTNELESMNPLLASKICADKNEWTLAYKYASMHGGKSAVIASALKHSQSLFKNGKYSAAIDVLIDKGLHKSEETLPFYSDLLNMLLSQINDSQTILINKAEAMDLFHKCKTLLHSLIKWLDKANNNNSAIYSSFQDLLHLFHLLFVKYQCSEIDELSELYNKQCVSLLSFCDWIRCDVLFADVGHSMKRVNKCQNAFIYYNHFIDICDNIDDSNDEIDYSDFVKCEHISIPHKAIPTKHIYNHRFREEIRDWVLEILATQEIRPISADQTRNNNNGSSAMIGKCIVSGTELFGGKQNNNNNIVKCRLCQQISEKQSWNMFVDYFKTCPWCQETQAPIY